MKLTMVTWNNYTIPIHKIDYIHVMESAPSLSELVCVVTGERLVVGRYETSSDARAEMYGLSRVIEDLQEAGDE